MPTRSNGHRCSPSACPCVGAPQMEVWVPALPSILILSSTAPVWGRKSGRGSFWPTWTVSWLVTEAGHPGLTPVCVSFWRSSMLRQDCNNQTTKAAIAANDFTTGARPQPSTTGTGMEGTPFLFARGLISNQWFQPSPCSQSYSHEQQSPH